MFVDLIYIGEYIFDSNNQASKHHSMFLLIITALSHSCFNTN